jgi:hypothetical protein
MIQLKKKNVDDPPGKLVSATSLKILKDVILKKNGDLLSSTQYKDKELVGVLKALSLNRESILDYEKGKCNYCETKPEPGSPLQVEHFRPKAKVDPQDNDKKPHAGYYWLGMEWTNLLLSCPTCNGKSGKSNRFPIRGHRATEVTVVDDRMVLNRAWCLASCPSLMDEKPLLINPEMENPADFLTFDLKGKMVGHGLDAERGDETWKIIGLNRVILVKDRLAVWDTFKKEILEEIASFDLGEFGKVELKRNLVKIFKKLVKRRSDEAEYALWGRFVNDNIQEFIREIGLDFEMRDLLVKLYKIAIS